MHPMGVRGRHINKQTNKQCMCNFLKAHLWAGTRICGYQNRTHSQDTSVPPQALAEASRPSWSRWCGVFQGPIQSHWLCRPRACSVGDILSTTEKISMGNIFCHPFYPSCERHQEALEPISPQHLLNPHQDLYSRAELRVYGAQDRNSIQDPSVTSLLCNSTEVGWYRPPL